MLKQKTHITDFEELGMRAILNLEESSRYGMEIKRFFQETVGRQISYGALYEALTRLEKRGYVESWLEEGGEERGGQPKRFFRVTGSGESALREAERIRERLPLSGLRPGVVGG